MCVPHAHTHSRAHTLTRMHTSMVVDRYIRVALVTPRGAAALAGLRVGDVILSCNGVGLLGATLTDAEMALGESTTANLEVAECTLPVPDFDRRGSERRVNGYGAMTASLAIRPLYCEVELRRVPGGGQGGAGFGVSVNTKGPDPIVESVGANTYSVEGGVVVVLACAPGVFFRCVCARARV